MPLQTNTNITPYFDDFNKDNNYQRILFAAGRTVQARELTQLQSQIQNQIERFGKNIFTEGSMVTGGGVHVITTQNYATISFVTGSVYGDITGRDGLLYIKSNVTGLIAKVSKLIGVVGTDPVTIFTDIINSGTGQQNTFSSSEACTMFVYNIDGSVSNIALVLIGTTGQGSWTKVQSGVYFIRGNFILTPDQSYVISKYSTNVTTRIGFDVSEHIITSTTDASLYSNANGFPNVNSSGADRLQVELTLTSLAVGAADANFVELARLENGVLQSVVNASQYSIIEDSIAQRTYETNGDYTVVPFGLNLEENLLANNNGGMYLPANGGDESLFVASIKPGISYVKGFRTENIAIQNISIKKARDTAFLNNSVTSADYGPYFLASTIASLPDINITKQIQLLDLTAAAIGYCRIRAVRQDGTNYRMYVFDLNFNTGKSVINVAQLKYSDSSSLFVATLLSSVLYNSNQNSLVFPLPISAVKSLQVLGASDTSYTVLRSFNLTTNSSGIATTSVGANESFAPVNPLTYFIADTGAANIGGIYNTNTITLTGTIVGTSISINLGISNANKLIKLIAPVIKSQPTRKNKTLVTVTNEAITFVDTNRQGLANSDIYNIISILDSTTAENITAQFTLDNGSRDSWYQNGLIIKTDSTILERSVNVTYQYFSHTAGDYFSVDSYTGINRTNVPFYNGVNLSDCIDFRPTKDINGNFTPVNVTGEIIKPGDTIRADITYYLPRNDIICVNEKGQFIDVPGISSITPSFPITPSDAMMLYQLSIPAYTSNASQIVVKQIDNKRYTMRDIGKIESRVSNLEYYTTLTMSEATANKTQVIDPVTGNNRFKNGFAVDGFIDFSLCDMASPEWSASLDLVDNTCNPSFMENGVNFSSTTLGGASKGTDVFVKAYTEVPAIIQPYATQTINVNPYAVFTWKGSVKLSPTSDFWNDVKYLQPIVINNVINLRGSAVQGSVWSITNKFDQITTVQTTNTFSSNTNSNTSSTNVDVSIIPFMRSINIGFTCTGFRPYTRLYPFWDSVDVSAFSMQSGGTYGGALVTDSNGSLVGTYTVPDTSANSFKTGISVFRFTDSSINSVDPTLMTTSGSTTFSSGGTLYSQQLTTTNTTTLTSTSVSTNSIAIMQQDNADYLSSQGGGGGGGGDPIAQTFVCPTIGGAFVTSFDIFFSTKSLNVPVTLQLRKVQVGIPSDIITTVTLNPSRVNVSTDGSIATRFTFGDPVYLLDSTEYAIVIIANTQDYNVFIATQGQNVIGSTMALSKQANLGVFLTSSNGSTWNPDQNSDMKFTLNRALFALADSTVTFNCDAPIALPLVFNAITTTTGSNVLIVGMKSHGLHIGDTTLIAGVVGGNNILATDINKLVTVTAATADTFSFVVSTNANITGTIGGTSITAIVNYPFNIFRSNAILYKPTNTDIKWTYQYKNQSSRTVSGFIVFDINNSVYLPNEAVIDLAGDFQIMATLSSTRDNLSPCINASGMFTSLISPRVNVTENLFNYVTNSILFDNPTSHARFYVGVQLPNQSYMRFYIKKIDTADQDLSLVPWVELIATNPITNSTNFVEYDYALDGNFVGYKIKLAFTGSNSNIPVCSDLRTIAFA